MGLAPDSRAEKRKDRPRLRNERLRTSAQCRGFAPAYRKLGGGGGRAFARRYFSRAARAWAVICFLADYVGKSFGYLVSVHSKLASREKLCLLKMFRLWFYRYFVDFVVGIVGLYFIVFRMYKSIIGTFLTNWDHKCIIYNSEQQCQQVNRFLISVHVPKNRYLTRKALSFLELFSQTQFETINMNLSTEQKHIHDKMHVSKTIKTAASMKLQRKNFERLILTKPRYSDQRATTYIRDSQDCTIHLS